MGEGRRVRLVVLDVDGTLLTSDARLTPGTAAAVGRARGRGMEVCLATSRGPGGLRWLVGQLDLDPWVVAFQGALVGRLDRTGALVGAALVDEPMPAWAARAVLAEAAAVGDGHNDLGLLGAVGLPIAMGNAKPALKRVAAFVTGSNDEDGVAAALDRLAGGG